MRCTALVVGIEGLIFNVARCYWVGMAGKGGGGVAEIPDELEIERVRNLIVGFGWVVSKVELKTDRIILTVELERESKEGGEPAGPT